MRNNIWYILLFLVTSVAYASNSEEKLIEVFSGVCLYNTPAFEKMLPFAEISNWQELSAQESEIFAPVEKGVVFKGWRFTDSGENYLAGYSAGQVDDLSGKTCTLVASSGDREEIINQLAKANIIEESLIKQTQGFQTNEAWHAKVNGIHALVFLTTYKEKEGGVLAIAIKD